MGLEFIFAGLETFTCFKDEHAADEYPGLIDNAFAGQDIGDIADAGTVWDVDDAILRQRAWLLEALLADKEHDTRDHRQQYKNADDGITDDDERMPRACRAAGR